MELKHYETLFILTPVLSSDQVKASISKYKSFLIERHAKISYEEEMGLKLLAYPINHKIRGFYNLIGFIGVPDSIKELEIAFARDVQVLRFLTSALDKHALAYNADKAAKGAVEVDQQKEPKEEV